MTAQEISELLLEQHRALETMGDVEQALKYLQDQLGQVRVNVAKAKRAVVDAERAAAPYTIHEARNLASAAMNREWLRKGGRR